MNTAQLFKALLHEDWTTKRPEEKVFPSVWDYHEAYKAGSVTPRDVVRVLLPLIRREEKGECSVAFLECREDLILKAAEESERRWREGRPLSPLDGLDK